jgi:signal transduction histidine kinase
MTAWRRLFSSTAMRLSALFLALFLVTAIALIYYVTSFSVRVLQSQTRVTIEEQLSNMNTAYERAGIPGLIRFVENASRQPGAALYLIADQSGRILSGNVQSVEAGVLDEAGWVVLPFSYERFNQNEDRAYRAIGRVIRLPNGLILMVGRDVGEPERFRVIVRQALALALGIMTLGALAIWFLVGRGALKRIDAVAAESRRIIGGDLTRRLPVNGSNDEFDRLALSLNGLIERISKLDLGVRDVATNVAHDLRTPLTRIRSRAEHALAHSRDCGESLARAA